MQITCRTVDAFLEHWNGQVNVLLAPELIRFELDLPPCEEVIDILRRNERSRVQIPGIPDEAEREKRIAAFRTQPLEDILESPFTLANFHLQDFYGKGQFLEHFQRDVMIPWRTFLSAAGFTWQRCYPIIFISGKGCSSSYHADNSHVLAWQVYGTKNFNGFKDPQAVLPAQQIVDEKQNVRSPHPPEADPESVVTYEMVPGDLLWNQFLTPHWVDGGGNQPSMSINLSHGGIQYQGRFCPNEVILRKRWEAHPEEAWLVDERY